MKTDRFIALVYNDCPELNPDTVHQATLITLDTLCEHLPAGQARDMASQLPDEIADAVQGGGDRADTTDVPIELEAFYDKLMFRTELDEGQTRTLAHSIARTLAEALSEGETGQAALELPPQLDKLLAA